MKIKFTLATITIMLAGGCVTTYNVKLADNGVTVLCDHLSVDKQFEYDSRKYLVVNNDTARTQSNLQKLKTGEIRYCTSHVTNMAYMLRGVYTLDDMIKQLNDKKDELFTSFNQPINDWDVSNVTTMENLFSHTNMFDQPINDWDVSSVVDMSGMFLKSEYFNQPIDNWDVSNVTNMSLMFYNAPSFNQPLDKWNVSNVINMSDMFSGAESFNQPIGQWDVSKVTNMSSMFWWARSFNQDIRNWDVSKVTNMEDMFWGARSFNQDISNWAVQPDQF